MSKDKTQEATPLETETAVSVVQQPQTREIATLTPSHLREQVNLIQGVMREVMQSGEHYGVIPGCGDKPSLLKPGAEKLALTFRLCPEYKITRTDMENDHREYEVVCILTHITSGQVLGQGVGCCSTKEGKYRYRNAGLTCPECGKMDTIIKGKAEYGGGWVCFARKNGCGAKFADDDEAITKQPRGKVDHDNPADYYNTVLKMAKKRAQIDATLTATGASDIFTQDIEDMPEVIPGAAQGPQPTEAPASQTQAQPATQPQPTRQAPAAPATEYAKPAAMTPGQKAEIDKGIAALSQNPEHKKQVVAWVLGVARAAGFEDMDATQAAVALEAISAQLG